MFETIKINSKNQITEEIIKDYFKVRDMKYTIKVVRNLTLSGVHNEQIVLPFIIASPKPGHLYHEIVFNSSYITNNYPNVIKFCMDVETYLNEHPYNQSALYEIEFMLNR